MAEMAVYEYESLALTTRGALNGWTLLSYRAASSGSSRRLRNSVERFRLKMIVPALIPW